MDNKTGGLTLLSIWSRENLSKESCGFQIQKRKAAAKIHERHDLWTEKQRATVAKTLALQCASEGSILRTMRLSRTAIVAYENPSVFDSVAAKHCRLLDEPA